MSGCKDCSVQLKLPTPGSALPTIRRPRQLESNSRWREPILRKESTGQTYLDRFANTTTESNEWHEKQCQLPRELASFKLNQQLTKATNRMSHSPRWLGIHMVAHSSALTTIKSGEQFAVGWKLLNGHNRAKCNVGNALWPKIMHYCVTTLWPKIPTHFLRILLLSNNAVKISLFNGSWWWIDWVLN